MGLEAVARTHVIIDEEILRRIDALAGARGRSRFLEDAAREKLSRIELKAALEETAGVMNAADYPEFRDLAAIEETIRQRRAGDDA